MNGWKYLQVSLQMFSVLTRAAVGLLARNGYVFLLK